MLAYLGPEGTFTEQAALAFGADVTAIRPYPSIAAVLDALRTGAVDRACVPVENSVEGSVPATLDELADAGVDPVIAVAETVLRIEFSVLVRPGTEARDVRTVSTHPHAEAQTRHWVRAHLPSADMVPAASTAAAAVAVRQGTVDAAICAPTALRHHRLAELATGVNDVADARTRFLLLRRPGALPAPTGTDRTSLVVSTADRPGALVAVLAEFASRGIDLTRIESRPAKDRLGSYLFFLDCDGHAAGAAVGDALAALRRRCEWIRFLGSYPRFGDPRPGPDETAFGAAAGWLDDVRAGRGA